jgi:defect-in-organelle-trafficking protein DotA
MLRKQRWLFSLILFLITSAAFADSSTDPTIASAAVSNHTDLSINFLGQLFGTVGNSLSGTSGQMLGKLFYELNVGILIVAGIWLSYTVVTLLFGAATEGGFMSGRNNTILAFLKVAIGVGALIPSPTTGYNAIQDIFMKVVVQSVALADMTWSHGLNYLAEGGAVWTPPAASSMGNLNSSSFSTMYGKVIVPTFNSEVCMYKASIAAQARSNTNGGSSYSSNALNPADDQSNMRFTFPNSKDPAGAAGCGTFEWGKIPGASGGKDSEGEYAYEAGYKVVYGLLPAAKNYACSITKSAKGSICDGLNQAIDYDTDSEVLFNNVLGYVNTITPLAKYELGGVSSNASAFLQIASNQGWILAGRYYWDLTHMADAVVSAAQISHYIPPSSSSSSGADQSKDSTFQTLTTMVAAKFANYSQASNAGGGSWGGWGGGGGNKWTAPFINTIYGDIKMLISQFSTPGSDPIYFLHRVGTLCINIAGDIWFDLAIIAGSLMLIGMVCSGGSLDLDKPIGAAVGWIKPLCMALAGVLIANGAILAFYVPVYAFFIFTFGVISWFILVVETMVAAPLVAFGLTHPQGHDFLGKVEQSLMLLLGVFLRPTLMIIGLFSAMILAFIAFRLVNFGFSSFMFDVFTTGQAVPFVASNATSPLTGMTMFMAHGMGPASLGSAVFVIIGVPIMMMMYSMAVFSIVNQCFSMVYKLPDYIMRWIGAPAQDSGIQQLMGSVQEAVGGTAKGMGQGTSESLGAATEGAAKFAGKKAGEGINAGRSAISGGSVG